MGAAGNYTQSNQSDIPPKNGKNAYFHVAHIANIIIIFLKFIAIIYFFQTKAWIAIRALIWMKIK